MKIIIFDFEVFKYDTLLGALILDDDNVDIFQSWDIDEIREFYEVHKNSIWVGWNNERYDNHILNACVKGIDPKVVNDNIINNNKRYYLDIDLIYFDVMKTVGRFSLKNSEAIAGKKISESEVDFNLDRRLTNEEMRLTEEYNLNDIEQTFDNFISRKDDFTLRLRTIQEFDLPLSVLPLTDSMLGEKVFKAKRIKGIEKMVVKPVIYDNLYIKNQEVKDFFLNEDFIDGKKLKVNFSGVEHTIASGGIHGAKTKYYAPKALHLDVSGYYNLIMILYKLLPRSIPPEGAELYESMYYEQLELRGIDDVKRAVLKLLLLCVFGSTMNKYLAFYDPYHGRLITLVGQMFLVDLLEKLEGMIELVQSNTDGIIVIPLEGYTKDDIIEVVNEWQTRTGFTLRINEFEDLYQRDVNCYLYRKDGKIYTVGGDMKDYNTVNLFSNRPEPRVIGWSIVNYFMNGMSPEETIEQFKNEPTMFQYISRLGVYEWFEVEVTDLKTNDKRIEYVQKVNRVFASNDKFTNRELFKCRSTGKTRRARMQSYPDNIFIYNDEVLSDEAAVLLSHKIDYNYYIKRSYEKIAEFIDIPTIKRLNI